jgi:hypothetical protein
LFSICFFSFSLLHSSHSHRFAARRRVARLAVNFQILIWKSGSGDVRPGCASCAAGGGLDVQIVKGF